MLADLTNAVSKGQDFKAVQIKIRELLKGETKVIRDVGKSLGVNGATQKEIVEDATTRFRLEEKIANKTAEGERINTKMKTSLADIASRAGSFGTMFTTAIRGAAQFASGLNMISSAAKQIKEEGLGLSSITSMLMAIPMVIPGGVAALKGLAGMVGFLSG
jgi:hypothetical protein